MERVEGKQIEFITSPVAMEMYLGTIIPANLSKSIKNSIFWGSKHAPNTVGEVYDQSPATTCESTCMQQGTEPDEDQTKPVEDVVINEISRKV